MRKVLALLVGCFIAAGCGAALADGVDPAMFAKVHWSREVQAELQAEYGFSDEQAAGVLETVIVHPVEVDGVWYQWTWTPVAE